MGTGHVIYGVGRRRRFVFRPLSDQALFQLGAETDVLLPGILAPSEGDLTAEDLPELPLVDYELMLAHFYAATFGTTIGQNLDCAECQKKFAIEFSLPAWLEDLRGGVANVAEQSFEGEPFALPTRKLLGEIPRERGTLALRLWQGEAALSPDRMAAFEATVARACPVLVDQIVATCPRCGETVRKRYILRRHLAARLASRLRALLAQIHVLASNYHWAAADILDLPRQTRAALVDTIRERAQRGRAAAVR